MSLDLYLTRVEETGVFSANITHNLNRMAEEAGIYNCLWQPQENGFSTASELIALLQAGIEKMEAEPERFKAFDAKNGWGTYDSFLPWLRRVLAACIENPDAKVRASR